MNPNTNFQPCGATDDRFLSVEFLSYDLDKIAKSGRTGDAAQMRAALGKLREWRAEFDQELTELEAAVADFAALDGLFDHGTTHE